MLQGEDRTWYLWNKSLAKGELIRTLRSTEEAPKWAFLIFLLDDVLFTFSLATVVSVTHLIRSKTSEQALMIECKVILLANNYPAEIRQQNKDVK